MPFDDYNLASYRDEPEQPGRKMPKTPEERRRALAEMLEAEALSQPHGRVKVGKDLFSWFFPQLRGQYEHCGYMGCAIGLAHLAWGEDYEDIDNSPFVQAEFWGLTEEMMRRIFYNREGYWGVCGNYFYHKPDYQVTPRMVAEALRATF